MLLQMKAWLQAERAMDRAVFRRRQPLAEFKTPAILVAEVDAPDLTGLHFDRLPSTSSGRTDLTGYSFGIAGITGFAAGTALAGDAQE